MPPPPFYSPFLSAFFWGPSFGTNDAAKKLAADSHVHVRNEAEIHPKERLSSFQLFSSSEGQIRATTQEPPHSRPGASAFQTAFSFGVPASPYLFL